MKTILYFPVMVFILLTTAQMAQGQTFELCTVSADSTAVDSIVSKEWKPVLIEVIHTPSHADSKNMHKINPKNNLDTVRSAAGSNMLRSLYYDNLHPHIPNQFPVDQSKVVGEIPIHHQVTANGATAYTVPIECAPGRAGVQPSVALSYNSLGGNGIPGFGWSIGGLSSINRTVSSFYYDGAAKPVEMIASAAFVLDGAKLIQTNTTGYVRTFAPEQGNLRVEAFVAGNVTKYFKAWFPNGSTAIYGYENNTANKLQYPLTCMTDVAGNTIKYIYDEVNNHYYIREIKYGSSKTITNDFASIKFGYKTRSDVGSGYEAGMEIAENRLLDYIQCVNSSTVIRTYYFAHTVNRGSLLTQIDCNLAGGSLNPLKFYYGTNNPQTAFDKSTAQLTSWFSNTAVASLVVGKGKFDMWSDDDALIAYPALNPYHEWNNQSNRWYENRYHPNQTLLVYPGLADNLVIPSEFTAGEGFMELTSGDVDGKNGDELIKINNTVSGTTDYLTFNMYKPSGIGGYYTYKTANYSSMTALDYRGRKSITPKVFVLGDFAGTGRLQVCAISRRNPLQSGNATRIMVFDMETQTTLCSTVFAGFNFSADNDASDIAFAMDYNGDGRAEICHVHESGTDVYAFSGTASLYLTRAATITDLKRNMANSRKLMVGDINGDGKTDLLLSPDASWHYSYETTVSVTEHHFCPYCGRMNPGPYNCRNCYAYLPSSDYCYQCGTDLDNGYCPNHGTDVNITVTEFVDNGNEWTVYYAKGADGFDRKTQAIIRHDRAHNAGVAASYVLQDVNSDGRTDLVRFHNGSISVFPASGAGISAASERAYTYTGNAACLIPTVVGKGNYHTQLLALNNGNIDRFIFTRNDARERMMSGAVSSLGVVNKSEYAEINDAGYPQIYQKGYGAVFPYEDFDGYIRATSESQTWYNNTQISGDSYFYAKAVIHRQGRGFLGFTNFYATDIRGRTVTQTFDPLNYGVLKKVETPVSVTENQYYVYTRYDKTAVVRPTQQKVTDLLKGNAVTTNYLSYDAYSNPLSVETEYGAGSGIKTKREYLYSNTSGSSTHIIGLPAEEKITNTRGGSSWIDKTVTTYNAAWLPATKTTYTGVSGTMKTGYESFTYDTEGNIASRSVTPFSSSKTQTAAYTYDANKRLLITETDPMNLTVTYGYDGFGRPASSTDYLNNATSYEYDALDRRKKVFSPDGVTGETLFAWNTGNNGSVLSVTTAATGRPTGVKYVDAFGRTVRESAAGFDGAPVFTDYLYDAYGRLCQKSEPYPASGTPRYFTCEYDGYDRVKKVTAPSGRITSTTYSDNTNTVTTTDAGMAASKTFDASGALVQATDPGGTIAYSLRPDGQPESITALGGAVTSFEYDGYGRQTKINDPSAGAVQYQYNAEGLLWKETDARNQTIQHTYTDWGQPLQTVTPEQTVNYTYHATYKDRLTKIAAGTHYEMVYGYDDLGRVNRETEREGTVTLVKDYTYEAGRVKTEKYNNVASDVLTYHYNPYGHLSSLQFGSATIYTVTGRNHPGQLTGYTYGNGTATTRTYSAAGSPLTIKAQKPGFNPLTNFSYTFDDVKGLPSTRNDMAWGSGQETFGYDGLNRLVTYGNTAKVHGTVGYGINGNIESKTDAGTFGYNHPGRPYQISDRDDFPETADTALLTVSYTSGRQPLTISKSGNTASFAYNHAGQRTKMAVTGTSANYIRTYLGGNYEREESGGTVTELLYLGGTPYSAPAVAFRIGGGAWQLHYIHRDYLGSIVAVSNASGAAVEQRSYDAWGRLRHPYTLQPYAYDGQPIPFLRRGYTGHEHLPEFGLINMNARLYDPVIGRFLSPDPYVQTPDFSQSFNRYSYAWNNPMVYTDPDGESIILALAIISAWMGMGQAMISSDKSGWGLVGDMAKGFVVGAASGAVGAWAGGTVTGLLNFSGIAGGFLSGAAGGFAGGFVGGAGNAWAFGADFGQGLQAGLIGGGYGALAGGIIGGLLEGIQHQRQLIAFRKGNQSLGINESNPVPATDEFLSKAQKAWYKKAPMDKVKTFTVEKVPASIQNLLDGNKSPGLTRALSVKGNLTGYSNVYFNKNLAFLSAKDLFYTMGHEFVHVSQFAALAGQSANLLRQPGFIDMLEFHAYSYQNILGGTHLNSFTGADIINWQNTYPQFNSMGYLNFPWTFEHSFLYPF